LAELPLGRTAPEAEAASVNDLKLDCGERQAIEQAVKKHAFNISTAATELELSRGTPYPRMGKHAFRRRVAVRRARTWCCSWCQASRVCSPPLTTELRKHNRTSTAVTDNGLCIPLRGPNNS
jgi:hypothetical protein